MSVHITLRIALLIAAGVLFVIGAFKATGRPGAHPLVFVGAGLACLVAWFATGP